MTNTFLAHFERWDMENYKSPRETIFVRDFLFSMNAIPSGDFNNFAISVTSLCRGSVLKVGDGFAHDEFASGNGDSYRRQETLTLSRVDGEVVFNDDGKYIIEISKNPLPGNPIPGGNDKFFLGRIYFNDFIPFCDLKRRYDEFQLWIF